MSFRTPTDFFYDVGKYAIRDPTLNFSSLPFKVLFQTNLLALQVASRIHEFARLEN